MRWFFRAFILIVLLVIGSGLWFWVGVVSSGPHSTPVSVTILPGQGINEISKTLYDVGAIRNTLIFETYVWLLRKEDRVQAGVYELPANVSMVKVMKQMVSGEVSEKENTLTFIEGWTLSQIADEVQQRTNVESEVFLSATQEVKNEDYSFLSHRPSGAGLEGFLFPDTYRVYKQTTAEEILKRGLENFDRKLTPELRARIAASDKTIFEIVTLASIVEREVQSKEDKKNAADVFWKRLKLGMALQSDATVNFVTGKKKTAVSSEDLAIDSPYNTYKYTGLPPGPISNPGLDAIEAAIEPTANDYYYFLTKDDGKAVFAKNLEEHNQNKAKYLK